MRKKGEVSNGDFILCCLYSDVVFIPTLSLFRPKGGIPIATSNSETRDFDLECNRDHMDPSLRFGIKAARVQS